MQQNTSRFMQNLGSRKLFRILTGLSLLLSLFVITENTSSASVLITIDDPTPLAAYFGAAYTITGTNLDHAATILVYSWSPLPYIEYDVPSSSFISQSATSITFRMPAINSFSTTGVPGNLTATDGGTFDLGAVNGPEMDSYVPASITISKLPVSTSISDPIQKSSIATITPNTPISGSSNPVVLTGNFFEKVTSIQVNGISLAAGSWKQTASSITFTVSTPNVGKYSVQVYNGSVPVMKEQSFNVVSTAQVAPGTLNSKSKVTYLECIKGHQLQIIRGVNPLCPTGFVKK